LQKPVKPSKGYCQPTVKRNSQRPKSISGSAFGAARLLSLFFEPVIVPKLDPVIVPAFDPVIVPGLEPVIVPGLEPVIVPANPVEDSVKVRTEMQRMV